MAQAPARSHTVGQWIASGANTGYQQPGQLSSRRRQDGQWHIVLVQTHRVVEPGPGIEAEGQTMMHAALQGLRVFCIDFHDQIIER